MQKLKKSIAVLLIISLLSGMGLFNCASVIAFAEEDEGYDDDDSSLIMIDDTDPFDPIYVDENGEEVDMDALYSELAEDDTSYNADELPSSYDSRRYNYVSAVKNQGNYGTCWAHATMSCLESDAIIKGYYTTSNADFSEAHLAWFAKNPVSSTYSGSFNDGSNINQFPDAIDTGGSADLSVAVLSRGEGIAKENTYTYPGRAYGDSDRFVCDSGLVLNSAEYVSSYDEIKQWVMDHGAAYISYTAYKDANYKETKYMNYDTNAYYNPSDDKGQYGGGHAISIVGWDDNFSKNNFNSNYRPSKNGAWLVKNSWGTGWGDNGYFWISYYNNIRRVSGFTVSKSEGLKNNYSYTGDMAYWTITSDSSSISLANVYTAKETEKLSKVAFYTAQPDLSVNVKVYTLNSGFSSPASGTLKSSVSKKIHNTGYYTVDLKNKVELSAGQLFSVVVEYSANTDTIMYKQEIDYKYPVKYAKNESWGLYNGKWYDNTDAKVSGKRVGNNFINAITESVDATPTPPPTPSSIKLTASPSSLTLKKGETQTVRISLSQMANNLTLSLEGYDSNYVAPQWSSSTFNGYADLKIKGIKVGSKSVKVSLYDRSTGDVLDTITISVSIKDSTSPDVNDYSNVKVTIVKPSVTTIGYWDSLYLHATVKNLPAGAKVVWSVNGETIRVSEPEAECNISGHASDCRSCKIECVNSGASKVICTVCDANGNPLQYNNSEISDSVTINGRYNIFMLIFGFILMWFGRIYTA